MNFLFFRRPFFFSGSFCKTFVIDILLVIVDDRFNTEGRLKPMRSSLSALSLSVSHPPVSSLSPVFPSFLLYFLSFLPPSLPLVEIFIISSSILHNNLEGLQEVVEKGFLNFIRKEEYNGKERREVETKNCQGDKSPG